MNNPIIVAISGASGSLYGMRLMGRLIEAGINVHLIVTENGQKVVQHELGFNIDYKNCASYISDSIGIRIEEENLSIFDNKNLFAPPASGSASYDTMVIIPCSMNTLSSVATGRASNLIERAADVFLKERRRLILVPRETPLSAIHLENMLKISNAGGIILPAMPAFYFKPDKIEDLADFIASKVFNIIGISSGFIKHWTDESRQ
jgi:4-hydroxy-3-polyprenylbenzoate decarboxylase